MRPGKTPVPRLDTVVLALPDRSDFLRPGFNQFRQRVLGSIKAHGYLHVNVRLDVNSRRQAMAAVCIKPNPGVCMFFS